MNMFREDLLKIITDALSKEQFDNFPAELYEPIKYTMSLGGKRIRPLMTLMACDMFGGQTADAIYPAIGLEVFHNFTLIHDDILDNASLRRGKETVFKKWNANRAILSGDTMFALSYNYFFKTNDVFILPVLKIFNKTAIEVCQGQQYDMNFETKKEVSLDDYLEMIRLKTAVLLGACVKIGALIGRASEEDALLIYNFAENLGIAFQLKDDILDLYSNQDVFGKKTGGDIVSNKKTFLYLKALELSDVKNKEAFEYWFGHTDEAADIKINAVKKIYDSLNIRQETELEINKYYQIALNSLKAINIDNKRKDSFYEFANNLMGREK